MMFDINSGDSGNSLKVMHCQSTTGDKLDLKLLPPHNSHLVQGDTRGVCVCKALYVMAFI